MYVSKISCCCPKAFESANHEFEVHVDGFSVNFQAKSSGLLQEK